VDGGRRLGKDVRREGKEVGKNGKSGGSGMEEEGRKGGEVEMGRVGETRSLPPVLSDFLVTPMPQHP